MKKAIIKVRDSHVGNLTIVIPKIRDYHKSFSSVVITYDNGNTRNIESDNLNKTIEELDTAIENFFSEK